jgi:hypothetical protein
MKYLLLSGFAAMLIMLAGCKSTKKLYEQGSYDRALYSALDDLRKNPENETARRILPSAYNEAVSRYETQIRSANMGTVNAQKLSIVFNDYRALQKMYDAIAASPAGQSLVSAHNYSSELNDAAERAADFHYNLGMDMLQRGDRISAQQAYENFIAVDSYVRGYRDVEDRKRESYDLAVINVIVDKFDQRFDDYRVNGNYFQNDIVSNLNNIGGRHYYKFYGTNDPRSGNVRVDQYMDINIYDIRFGQLASDTYSYEVTKDIADKDAKDTKETKTITVKATVYVTHRLISSQAVMDYRITDAVSRRMVGVDRIPAQYNWEKSTGRYSGDSRALSDKDWAIINGKFSNQPEYDELYRELTNRMMDEFRNRMRVIYGR